MQAIIAQVVKRTHTMTHTNVLQQMDTIESAVTLLLKC